MDEVDRCHVFDVVLHEGEDPTGLAGALPRRPRCTRDPARLINRSSSRFVGDTITVMHLVSLAVLLVVTPTAVGQVADPAEPLLHSLPPGLVVESSTEVPTAQAEAIGRKLGGRVRRLTNSHLRVHGRSIRVNVITAVDEGNAEALHAGLSRIKSAIFCLRKGDTVVEYVGGDLDVAIATKTSYELGLLEKPARVRYRVVADLATVERPDPMACNELFNQLVATGDGTDRQAARRIDELSRGFTFGRTLRLRSPKVDGGSPTHRLLPPAVDAKESGATIAYSFGDVPLRQGIPFVTVTIDVAVDHTGFREDATAPGDQLTAATPFWPSDDAEIVELARGITAGKSTHDAKVAAILEWLSPGRNLQYSGQAGSRWGTRRVLEQKFGHCWDFSDCFVTLARAAGVPSRQAAGWFYGSSGHVWAEFHREGEGWQQVDPTGGGTLTCGIYHIPYFTSEDGEMPILYVAMPEIEVVEAK